MDMQALKEQIDKLDHTEIGIILGIHQTTVSQHIRYGIKKLKVFCNGNNR